MLSLKQISIISTIYLYDDIQKNVPYCNALQYFLRHTISPPPPPPKKKRERERESERGREREREREIEKERNNNNKKQKKTNKQSVKANIKSKNRTKGKKKHKKQTNYKAINGPTIRSSVNIKSERPKAISTQLTTTIGNEQY